jgi:hypothetical protein
MGFESRIMNNHKSRALIYRERIKAGIFLELELDTNPNDTKASATG